MRLHRAERDRLDSLASYDIVGAHAEPGLDAVTALLAELCDVPIAALTVLDADQQWFTSLHGADVVSLPREESFCADVVADGDVLVVPDALAVPTTDVVDSRRGGLIVGRTSGRSGGV